MPVDSIPPKVDFSIVQQKYSTLIPTMNGWFITKDSLDKEALLGVMKDIQSQEKWPKPASDSLADVWMLAFVESNDGIKWGVIDSSGRSIVPFICDGVRQAGSDSLIYSIYRWSYSLNTGIPRYNYVGYLFTVNNAGQLIGSPEKFEMTVTFLGDDHRIEWVTEKGHDFFLPKEFGKGHLDFQGRKRKS